MLFSWLWSLYWSHLNTWSGPMHICVSCCVYALFFRRADSAEPVVSTLSLITPVCPCENSMTTLALFNFNCNVFHSNFHGKCDNYRNIKVLLLKWYSTLPPSLCRCLKRLLSTWWHMPNRSPVRIGHPFHKEHLGHPKWKKKKQSVWSRSWRQSWSGSILCTHEFTTQATKMGIGIGDCRS